MRKIDLNCDLGEWKNSNGLKKDASIMPFITSCNIACGGHIGDQNSMRSTICLAMEHDVGIGGHPSYPDQENFGRKVIEISAEDLRASLIDQLNTFLKYTELEGGELHHIKPHGALYNEAAINPKVANIVIEAIQIVSPEVPIYTQQDSVLDKVAQNSGIRVIYEVFSDRSYDENLRLRSRSLPGAIIHEKEEVFKHIHRMVIDGSVKTYSGNVFTIKAETMCLHSDTEGSVELARSIFEYMKSNGVEIATA